MKYKKATVVAIAILIILLSLLTAYVSVLSKQVHDVTHEVEVLKNETTIQNSLNIPKANNK